MERRLGVLMAAACLLILAGTAYGQSGGAANPSSDKAGVQAAGTPAAPTQATADPVVEAVKAKGRTVPAKEAKATDEKLAATAKGVDAEASAHGESKVADRLAKQFGMTAEALQTEKTQFNTGWGNLMIAHILLANAKTQMTMDQLMAMRADGMGWGQIAHGMGFKLGELVSAAKVEQRVALGKAKPTGKVAQIHGPGSRAGEKMEHAKAGMGMGSPMPKGKEGK